jgi:hypothetical protein
MTMHSHPPIGIRWECPACALFASPARVELKPKAWDVMRRAVEDGVAYGLRRSQKHVDAPLSSEEQKRIADQIVTSVLGEISEWFDP